MRCCLVYNFLCYKKWPTIASIDNWFMAFNGISWVNHPEISHNFVFKRKLQFWLNLYPSLYSKQTDCLLPLLPYCLLFNFVFVFLINISGTNDICYHIDTSLKKSHIFRQISCDEDVSPSLRYSKTSSVMKSLLKTSSSIFGEGLYLCKRNLPTNRNSSSVKVVTL